jgi:hypothetical protein
MSQDDGKPKRTWQEIAEEASHERDPVRLQELAKELEQALEQRAGKLAQNSTPPSKAKSA